MKGLFFISVIFFVLIEPFCSTVEVYHQYTASLKLAHLPTAVRQFASSRFVQQLRLKDLLIVEKNPPSLDPLNLIPGDALLVLDISDAAAGGRAFYTSPFGQTLISTDWSVILKKMEVKKHFRRPFEQNISALTTLLENPLIQEVFKKRALVALLPFIPSTSKNIEAALLKNLLLVTDLGKAGGVSVRLLALFNADRKEVLYYQGIPVHTLALRKNKKMYIASVGGQTVLSFTPQPVHRSIDLFIRHFTHKQNGILLNSEYKAVKKYGRDDDFFLYADLAKIKSLIFPDPLQEKYAAETDLQPQATGSRSVGFFHHRDENTHAFTAVVRFSSNQLLPLQKRIYTAPSVENHRLRSLPANLLVYFWTNWLEPEVWRQALLNRIEENEAASAGRIAAWFRAQTGMGPKEFASLFGREFGFNIAEISTAGFFPMPRICFMIEVRDREKVEQFLEKMISGLPVRRDKEAGIPVVSLMAAQGMMQPSYTFAEGFLLLADSRKQLVNILSNREERLVQDRTFQGVDTGMRHPSNLHLFARIDELINAMKELASWAGTMIAGRDRKTGAKSKVLVDQVISPLLDGLKMYKAVGGRSYTLPGALILEAAVLDAEPEDEQAVPNFQEGK